MIDKILRIISLVSTLILIALIIGCGDSNVLFKDNTYVIEKEENDVSVQVVNSYVPSVHNIAKEYIDTHNPCLYILEYNKNKLTVSSYNYDGDSEANFKLWKLDCVDHIIFKSVTIFDDNGDVTVENIEIPIEEYKYIGEYYTVGYVEFDTSGEVSSVTFYGETITEG